MHVNSDEGNSTAGKSPRIRVLIADDDDFARALISGQLEGDPSLEIVAAAKDTDEAISLALEHRPDVALLDLDMPGAGGWKVAEVIKEKSPHTQTIALTALDTAEAEYQSTRAGMVAVLKKGSPKSQIIDTIGSAMRRYLRDAPAELKPPGGADTFVEGTEPRLIDALGAQIERQDVLERRIAAIERSLGF